MTLATFPDIAPDRSSRKLIGHQVLHAKFGDGYGMTTPDGVNTQNESWDLSFEDYPAAQIDQIRDFLEAHRGALRFLWTPPGENAASEWKQIGEITERFPGYATKTLKFKLQKVYGVSESQTNRPTWSSSEW